MSARPGLYGGQPVMVVPTVINEIAFCWRSWGGTVTEPLFSDYGYTAFEKWTYKPIIYEEPEERTWIDFGQSFYQASLILVNGRPSEGVFLEDVEGVAAIFLFRQVTTKADAGYICSYDISSQTWLPGLRTARNRPPVATKYRE